MPPARPALISANSCLHDHLDRRTTRQTSKHTARLHTALALCLLAQRACAHTATASSSPLNAEATSYAFSVCGRARDCVRVGSLSEQTNRQTHKHTDRQTETGRQTNKHTRTHTHARTRARTQTAARIHDGAHRQFGEYFIFVQNYPDMTCVALHCKTLLC